MSILKYLKEELYTIDETRKHDISEYRPMKDIINEYKNRDDSEDIYVHFSETFKDSKNQNINQIGLNMSQDYGNPFGIYAYPINNIKGTFKTSAPYAYIIKNKRIDKWIQNISDMSIGNYMWCMKQLENEFFDHNNSDRVKYEKFTESMSDNKTHGGVLFYMIVRMSSNKTFNSTKRPSVWQTDVWRNLLGYSGIGDNNGSEIIHASEPYQAVFFSSKCFDIIDTVQNRHYLDSTILPIRANDIKNVKNAIELGAKLGLNDIFVAIDTKNLSTLDFVLNNAKYPKKKIGDIGIHAAASENIDVLKYIISKLKLDNEQISDIISWINYRNLGDDNFKREASALYNTQPPRKKRTVVRKTSPVVSTPPTNIG